MTPDAILVTLAPSGSDFITLQTYDPDHGTSLHFYLHRSDLEQLVTGDPAIPLLDSDLLNFVQVHRRRNFLIFKVTWLSANYLDEVTGYIQRFELPVSCCAVVLNGKTVRRAITFSETRSKAAIRFTPEGHQQIHSLCADKRTRRALCRFFRDNMNYGADEIVELTRDVCAGGFYFLSPDTGMDGGTIRHETEIKGHNGKAYPKVFFGLNSCSPPAGWQPHVLVSPYTQKTGSL